MQVTVLRNPGRELLRSLGIPDKATVLVEGATLDLPDELVAPLTRAGVVGQYPELKAIPPADPVLEAQQRALANKNKGGNQSRAPKGGGQQGGGQSQQGSGEQK
jgi:hypothetical protein